MQLFFKQWLIREMSTFSLPKGMKTANGTIDAIDLRFEDYPKNTEEEKDFVRRLLNPLPPPYFAKFPNSNRYLVFNGKEYQITLSPPNDEEYIELPARFNNGYSWWDYAAGYNGDKIIKKPLRMRVYD